MLNDKKSSNVATNNKKSKCKVIECYADKSDHEKSYKAVECSSVQLVKDSTGNVEKACVVHEKLKEDCVYTELMHGMLVDNLKYELCRAMCNSKYDCYLEVKDTIKT